MDKVFFQFFNIPNEKESISQDNMQPPTQIHHEQNKSRILAVKPPPSTCRKDKMKSNRTSPLIPSPHANQEREGKLCGCNNVLWVRGRSLFEGWRWKVLRIMGVGRFGRDKKNQISVCVCVYVNGLEKEKCCHLLM